MMITTDTDFGHGQKLIERMVDNGFDRGFAERVFNELNGNGSLRDGTQWIGIFEHGCLSSVEGRPVEADNLTRDGQHHCWHPHEALAGR